LIHHKKLNCAPKVDYIKPPAGRHVTPWAMHPKAIRGQLAVSVVPSNLTSWMPPIGNQDQIGACNTYGTLDAACTSLKKAGHSLPSYLARQPTYALVRCIEAASSTGRPPKSITDCGANPDDVRIVLANYGAMTAIQECGIDGPSDAFSQYEDQHVNDLPTLESAVACHAFRLVGAYDITSLDGDARLLAWSQALAAGYGVGFSLYAADDRFQGYSGGVLPDPPDGAGCDHWIYSVGVDADTMLPVGVNSWSKGWGIPWQSAPGGCVLLGPGTVQAADCVIVYSVEEVTP
jgi:hypothetical protein